MAALGGAGSPLFNLSQGLANMSSVGENMTSDPLLANGTGIGAGEEGGAAAGAHPCREVTSIPGVISNGTMQGLWAFSGSYSAVHGYVSTAVCLFGLMSNTANIIVLTRKNMISSTNTILMWLAVADLLTMMSYLPFAIHFYIMRDESLPIFHTRSFGWIIFLLFHASFSIVMHTVAIWLTIALAIFRYIYICMPTKGNIYCSLRRAKITIFVVYALTVVVCVPNYFSNRYKVDRLTLAPGPLVPNATTDTSTMDITTIVIIAAAANNNNNNDADSWALGTDGNGTGVGEEGQGEEGEGQAGTLLYGHQHWDKSEAAHITMLLNNWIQAIMIKLVPCIMLTTLTVLLIHAMHKAYRKRMRLKSQGRKAESDKHGEHNRTTGMLLAVVVLFTITELPQGILTLMNIFIDCFRFVVYDPLGDLLDAMALTNNSVNFVLYCSMSKQFRNTFMEVFCGFCAKHRPGWLKLKLITSSQEGNGAATTAVTTLAHSTNNVNHTHV
ncbi:G-protein coupled receptor dmsr-1-like [Babylonia areolata]|uniref:G-protein coupled receptor dmsr-1-like n=1 Tax=Babylonia areolata TaxID=304850 RepID=UPI003FD12995